MKKLLPTTPRLWISLALLLATLFSIPVGYGLAQDTMVVIAPQSSEVAVGATTTVDIKIENAEGLYGAGVHLTFNPSLLEVVDAEPGVSGVQIQAGTFLSPDFVGEHAVDQAAGKIDFAIAQAPPHEAVSGSGVLARVTFKGKVAGTSSINFTGVLLSDKSGTEISAGSQGGSIVVTEADTPTNTPTPEDTPTPTPQDTLTPTPTPEDTLTPTPTPAVATTPTPAPSVTPTPLSGDILGYHTVQPGETLYCIGRAYGVDPYAIASQNGILNPNIIHACATLAIPNAPRTLPAGRVCPAQFDDDEPPSACRWHHTVASGENLYRISLHYGVSMWAIAEANNITNLNYIRVGQVLCIP
ncbi:MAG TPA: LysM peptidoglycan-binding domain-containing protein [Thermoflexia bacterium]|nr:LysM peptidoglycan-binding domain-containing protein [Thermoflexia bacterium]